MSYIQLKDLDVYKVARELSSEAWGIYKRLDWQDKKIIGDQFITAIDSVGANIAEGYRRFHYLDKIKFYYIARASLCEACEHWTELLFEREKINKKELTSLQNLNIKLTYKLNFFIEATYNAKDISLAKRAISRTK